MQILNRLWKKILSRTKAHKQCINLGKSKTCSTMTLRTAFCAGIALPELEQGVSPFSSLLRVFSEGLVFVGGAILVSLLVLAAIGEVT